MRAGPGLIACLLWYLMVSVDAQSRGSQRFRQTEDLGLSSTSIEDRSSERRQSPARHKTEPASGEEERVLHARRPGRVTPETFERTFSTELHSKRPNPPSNIDSIDRSSYNRQLNSRSRDRANIASSVNSRSDETTNNYPKFESRISESTTRDFISNEKREFRPSRQRDSNESHRFASPRASQRREDESSSELRSRDNKESDSTENSNRFSSRRKSPESSRSRQIENSSTRIGAEQRSEEPPSRTRFRDDSSEVSRSSSFNSRRRSNSRTTQIDSSEVSSEGNDQQSSRESKFRSSSFGRQSEVLPVSEPPSQNLKYNSRLRETLLKDERRRTNEFQSIPASAVPSVQNRRSMETESNEDENSEKSKQTVSEAQRLSLRRNRLNSAGSKNDDRKSLEGRENDGKDKEERLKIDENSRKREPSYKQRGNGDRNLEDSDKHINSRRERLNKSAPSEENNSSFSGRREKTLPKSESRFKATNSSPTSEPKQELNDALENSPSTPTDVKALSSIRSNKYSSRFRQSHKSSNLEESHSTDGSIVGRGKDSSTDEPSSQHERRTEVTDSLLSTAESITGRGHHLRNEDPPIKKKFEKVKDVDSDDNLKSSKLRNTFRQRTKSVEVNPSTVSTPQLTRGTSSYQGNGANEDGGSLPKKKKKGESNEDAIDDDENYPIEYKQLRKAGNGPKEILALLKARKSQREAAERAMSQSGSPFSSRASLLSIRPQLLQKSIQESSAKDNSNSSPSSKGSQNLVEPGASSKTVKEDEERMLFVTPNPSENVRSWRLKNRIKPENQSAPSQTRNNLRDPSSRSVEEQESSTTDDDENKTEEISSDSKSRRSYSRRDDSNKVIKEFKIRPTIEIETEKPKFIPGKKRDEDASDSVEDYSENDEVKTPGKLRYHLYEASNRKKLVWQQLKPETTTRAVKEFTKKISKSYAKTPRIPRASTTTMRPTPAESLAAKLNARRLRQQQKEREETQRVTASVSVSTTTEEEPTIVFITDPPPSPPESANLVLDQSMTFPTTETVFIVTPEAPTTLPSDEVSMMSSFEDSSTITVPSSTSTTTTTARPTTTKAKPTTTTARPTTTTRATSTTARPKTTMKPTTTTSKPTTTPPSTQPDRLPSTVESIALANEFDVAQSDGGTAASFTASTTSTSSSEPSFTSSSADFDTSTQPLAITNNSIDSQTPLSTSESNSQTNTTNDIMRQSFETSNTTTTISDILKQSTPTTIKPKSSTTIKSKSVPVSKAKPTPKSKTASTQKKTTPFTTPPSTTSVTKITQTSNSDSILTTIVTSKPSTTTQKSNSDNIVTTTVTSKPSTTIQTSNSDSILTTTVTSKPSTTKTTTVSKQPKPAHMKHPNKVTTKKPQSANKAKSLSKPKEVNVNNKNITEAKPIVTESDVRNVITNSESVSNMSQIKQASPVSQNLTSAKPPVAMLTSANNTKDTPITTTSSPELTNVSTKTVPSSIQNLTSTTPNRLIPKVESKQTTKKPIVPEKKSMPLLMPDERIDDLSFVDDSSGDFFVYGLLPNKSLVRRVPSPAPRTELPFVVYGLYPNGTIVKRFPNGTVIPDEANDTNELVAANVEPNDRFAISELLERDKPPPRRTTTTTTTTTTTESMLMTAEQTSPVVTTITTPATMLLTTILSTITSTLMPTTTPTVPTTIPTMPTTTQTMPTTIPTLPTTPSPPPLPSTTTTTTMKPTPKPTTKPTPKPTPKPTQKPSPKPTPKSTPKQTTKPPPPAMKTMQPITTVIKTTPAPLMTLKDTQASMSVMKTTKISMVKATTNKPATTTKKQTPSSTQKPKTTTKRPAKGSSGKTTTTKKQKPPSTTPTPTTVSITQPQTTTPLPQATRIAEDFALLNSLLKLPDESANANSIAPEFMSSTPGMDDESLANRIIQLAIERAGPNSGPPTTGSALVTLAGTQASVLEEISANSIATSASPSATLDNSMSQSKPGGKISVWVVPNKEMSGTGATMKTTTSVPKLTAQEEQVLNVLLNSPSSTTANLRDQLLLAELLGTSPTSSTTTGSDSTNKKSTRKPKTSSTTPLPSPTTTHRTFPALSAIFQRPRGGLLRSLGSNTNLGDSEDTSESTEQSQQPQQGPIVSAAISMTRAVSHFMGLIIQDAAEQLEQFFVERLRVLGLQQILAANNTAS